MSPNELLLPPASRLVHIGVPKTGTTSLQRAFHAGRDELRRYGVHYAGATAQPRLAARAIAGGGRINGERSGQPADWDALVDEVRAAGSQRVVVSSEILSNADEAGARRVVTELAGGPVHVVVTLRSVARIAPSQWQQGVQDAGVRLPYSKFLDRMFGQSPYAEPRPLFWHRNLHGELVRRWAEAAGPQNLTVVVPDESDPDMLLRTFEALLGLHERTLAATADNTNRSLTRAEVELVRLINKHFREHDWSGPWSQEAHARVVRRGVVRLMKAARRPSPDEPRLVMPEWAATRAAELGAESVTTIRSLGVRVVGDLSRLAEAPTARGGGEPEPKGPALIPGDAAALAVLGAMCADGQEPSDGAKVAAALTILGATAGSGGRSNSAGMPLLRVGAVARTVLRVIEAGGTRAEVVGLPELPADAVALAVLSRMRAVGSEPAGVNDSLALGAARPVLDALGVNHPGYETTHRPTRWRGRAAAVTEKLLPRLPRPTIRRTR